MRIEKVVLSNEQEKAVKTAVAQATANRDYRPVVMLVIANQFGQVLFVRSSKGDTWYLPQGGVEDGEDLVTTARREIAEELPGLELSKLEFVRYLGYQDLDAPSDRADKRGYTKGKRYFALGFHYSGSDTFQLNRAELSAYSWASSGSLPGLLTTSRRKKRSLILKYVTQFMHNPL